jgi:GNAT superfamily N-acetyltransferase
MDKLMIREAERRDVPLIIEFITELAIYEKLLDEVVVTPDFLSEQLFEKKLSYCVLAFEETTPVGFALYFYNYSTFVGRNGLYLEDLFVRAAFRSKGYGKALLQHLIDIARTKQCGRMEWAVLDWNKPAIDFYKKLGARAMDEWTVFRLDLQKSLSTSVNENGSTP